MTTNHKFKYVVFVWYLTHSLPVTPINARASEVLVKTKSYSTVASPSKLENPSETALSIITPPAITLSVLKDAKAAGISSIWLQPGTYNDEIIAYAKKEFQAAIAGFESDSISTVGGEGWCVLVDGEDGLELAGRTWKKTKL
jgi:predicted CoA-binding protein